MSPLFIAPLLVVGTVLIHAAGFSFILQSLAKLRTNQPTQIWPVTWLLVKISLLLSVIHFAEIMLWALAYLWAGCLPDPDSAFYFSGVTYTTIGYGDVLLPAAWHLLAPIEGLMGILMCGLSTGLFFAVVHRIFMTRVETGHDEHLQTQPSR